MHLFPHVFSADFAAGCVKNPCQTQSMPADFFLVTDKIMRKNPHRKRYGTSSKNTKTSAPDLGTEVFSTYVCFVFVNVRRQVLQECRTFALLLLVVIDVHVATATYILVPVPASSGFSELTWCRKSGRRHRPDPERCSPFRSGSRLRRRSRCPHPDVLPAERPVPPDKPECTGT